MVYSEADVQRLIAEVADGSDEAVDALGGFLIAAADPAELDRGSRSPAMTALTRAATDYDTRAGYQLMLWVNRMREEFADQPDLLADIADFAGLETEYDAVQWWAEAADMGSAKAMRYLSIWCSEVEEPEEAIDWMKRASEAGDDEASYVVALLLREAGQDDEALVWLERAAVGGWPQALSEVSFRMLIDGEHVRATDLFEASAQACSWRATEGPELDQRMAFSYHREVLLRHWLAARCLDALHRLALGGPDEDAVAVWERGRDRGDLWSTISLAVLAARRGSAANARDLFTQLGRRDRRLVRAFFSAGVRGTGWFREWSRRGLSELESCPPVSTPLHSQPDGGSEADPEAPLREPSEGVTVIAPGGFGLLGEMTGQDYPDARQRLEFAAEGGDASAALELAVVLEREHWVDEAVEWYDRAAVAGSPNALGCVTWHHLLHGDHIACVDAFERARPACESRLESIEAGDPDADFAEQWLNARSNVALSRLALGGSPDQALAVWAEGAAIGHAESLIHPAILATREGRDRASYLAIAALSPKQRSEVRSALTDGVDAVGWFGQWCQQGLALLNGNPAVDGEVDPILLTVEEAIALRSFLHDRFDGPYGGPRGALEEVDLRLAAQSIPVLPIRISMNDLGNLALALPDSRESLVGPSDQPGATAVRLQLTPTEACLLYTLAHRHIAMSGLGETLIRIAHKLEAAGADVADLTLHLHGDARLDIESAERADD